MVFNNLPQNLKEEISNRNFPANKLKITEDWPIDLIKLILGFKLGINKTMQIIELLNDISLRDNKPIDAPLKSPEWLNVYNNPKYTIKQKGLLLRQLLQTERYPIYTKFRSKVKRVLDKLDLPKNNELLTLEKDSTRFKIELITDINTHSRSKDIKETTLSPSGIDSVIQGKLNICYTNHKGRFLKKCPGTPGYLCCNYYILNVQTNCNYDCHYCILQGYINNNRLNIYINMDTALEETESFLNANPDNFYRIGTGELTDSLSLDNMTNTNDMLIPFFIKQKNALLELKTKSNNIKSLLKYEPNGKIVVSWSLNPQKIIEVYETGTASLTKRLESARECAKNGYQIGLHLDPVILYPEWENDYHNLIIEVFKYIEPKDIIWISIAGFRYTSALKNIIQKRFPRTRLFLGEMIRCTDGKYRYIRPIRAVVYRKITGWIQQYNKDIPIYFCMESPAIWQDVFGKLPSEIPNLNTIFG